MDLFARARGAIDRGSSVLNRGPSHSQENAQEQEQDGIQEQDRGLQGDGPTTKVRALLAEMQASTPWGEKDHEGEERRLLQELQNCVLDAQSRENLEKLPKRMCAYEFKPGDIAWNCKVCQGAQDADPLTFLPPDLLVNSRDCIGEVMKLVLNSIKEARFGSVINEDDLEVVCDKLGSEAPEKRYSVIVHYNELQTSQEFATALNKAHPAIAYQMLKIVGETSSQKQSTMCAVQSLEHSDSSMDVDETDDYPMLRAVIMADSFLPKSESDALHSMLMALLADPLFKQAFAISFTSSYRQLYREFAAGVGSSTATILAFSVQFFNRATFVKQLVAEYDLLEVLVNSVLETLRKKTKTNFVDIAFEDTWNSMVNVLHPEHNQELDVWDVFAMGVQRSQGKYFPPPDYQVGDTLRTDQIESAVSCHFPLQRTLSQLIRALSDSSNGLDIFISMVQSSVLEDDESVWIHDADSAIGFWHRVHLIEPVLQAIVWDSQVHSGLWVRNGMSVINHSMNYGEPPFCARFRDLDLLLLQFSFQLLGVDWIMASIMERFDVEEWYEAAQSSDAKEAELMVTECLMLLSQLASELPPKVTEGDAMRSLVPYLRREIVQRLHGGSASMIRLDGDQKHEIGRGIDWLLHRLSRISPECRLIVEQHQVTEQESRDEAARKLALAQRRKDAQMRAIQQMQQRQAAFAEQMKAMASEEEHAAGGEDEYGDEDERDKRPHSSSDAAGDDSDVEMVHHKCWESYHTSQFQRAITGGHHRHALNAVDVTKKEFLCPLCKSISNVLIPTTTDEISKRLSTMEPRLVQTLLWYAITRKEAFTNEMADDLAFSEENVAVFISCFSDEGLNSPEAGGNHRQSREDAMGHQLESLLTAFVAKCDGAFPVDPVTDKRQLLNVVASEVVPLAKVATFMLQSLCTSHRRAGAPAASKPIFITQEDILAVGFVKLNALQANEPVAISDGEETTLAWLVFGWVHRFKAAYEEMNDQHAVLQQWLTTANVNRAPGEKIIMPSVLCRDLHTMHSTISVFCSGANRTRYLRSLPRPYVKFYSELAKRRCHSCHQFPARPAVCLLCGTLLCAANTCPSIHLDKGGYPDEANPGACTVHAKKCGRGSGMFLLVLEGAVLLVYWKLAAYVGSLYVDEYGEEFGERNRHSFP
ncbi:hypothetical protein JM16_000583 [Phytophthora kernoviae]|uniref:E3 ubiquitin-protein ligase n=1 Tax=Phytophthora kernoviae TaxID=325452 RepID=A0A8T0M9Q3_9STRA|nr:hypothetical protein JM16_000583 [Phytophthora kernoviae]